MTDERRRAIEDLSDHVIERCRRIAFDAFGLLDDDLDRAQCATKLLASVAGWAGLCFARSHDSAPPGTPEDEQALRQWTCAVLDLAKDIVTGEAVPKVAPLAPRGPDEERRT